MRLATAIPAVLRTRMVEIGFMVPRRTPLIAAACQLTGYSGRMSTFSSCPMQASQKGHSLLGHPFYR